MRRIISTLIIIVLCVGFIYMCERHTLPISRGDAIIVLNETLCPPEIRAKFDARIKKRYKHAESYTVELAYIATCKGEIYIERIK